MQKFLAFALTLAVASAGTVPEYGNPSGDYGGGSSGGNSYGNPEPQGYSQSSGGGGGVWLLCRPVKLAPEKSSTAKGYMASHAHFRLQVPKK